MTTYTWITNTSLDWNTATAWSTGTVPDSATADVIIDYPVAGGDTSYTVTIAAGETETVNSLMMNSTTNDAGTYNPNGYYAAALTLDGTLDFAAGSSGYLGSALQTFISVDPLVNASLINAGTIDGFVQVEGNLLLTGTNGVYITNDLQALGGTATIDTSSIADYNPATHTLFDSIFEAKGEPGYVGVIDLGGSAGHLIVNIATIMGPPGNPGGWTELTFYSSESAIDEWNGTAYQPVESTLTDIDGGGTVDVLAGRNYTTTNTLTVNGGTGDISTGMLNLQAGTVTTGGLDIDGGEVQGYATIDGAVVNNGELMAVGGTLTLNGSLSGKGQVNFDFDNKAGTHSATLATLTVNSVSSGQTIVMNGGDTLVLDAPSSFAGTISANAGDMIVLNGLTPTRAFIESGTLAVFSGSIDVANLPVVGDYLQDHIVVAGTTLTVAAGANPPSIAGTAAGQTVSDRGTIAPFGSVAITDINIGQTETVIVALSNPANGTLSNPNAGSYDANTGVYTVAGTPTAVTADLDALIFTPTAGQVAIGQTVATVFTIVDTDTAGATTTDSTTTVVATAAAPPPLNFDVTDTTTGATTSTAGTPYTGSLSGLTSEFVAVTTDGLAITATQPDVFIQGGPGNDAINVSNVNGNNVLDGSTGSNFLIGGTGDDTFYLDARGTTANVFDTIANFHSGDNATVYGVNATLFTLTAYDGQGAPGSTGLEFSFTQAGGPTVDIVLAGFTSADLTNGKLTVTYGTTSGASASPYMLIHAN